MESAMVYESTGPETFSPNDPLSSSGAEAQAAASELGRKAARKAEQVRTRAAEGLESAAKSVHAGGERVASAAHSAADALSSSAHYVRENEMRDMLEDMLDVVRSNPGAALLGAAALGFLIGRAISR
jgi:ElaB/YqjD/DUF883 family membrane-anchored ribosome-binding protein